MTVAERYNRIVQLALQRVLEELEPRMVEILEVILRRIATQTARTYRENVTDHLAASARRTRYGGIVAAGDPPPWTPPAADEVIDVQAVIRTLRTKTDPVREALIKAVMDEALNKGPLRVNWDLSNPFALRILEQSGSQITSIAETTQLNVMRVIRASWEEGLTIPDTAKAIRAGMREASPARARLIARTELVGAANGGSLAATHIASAATGIQFMKQWLTAEGAVFPRHEEYDGLDGQTVALDEYFDVGGYELQFPGDPDGPPEEVCNCRCALAYVEADAGGE